MYFFLGERCVFCFDWALGWVSLFGTAADHDTLSSCLW